MSAKTVIAQQVDGLASLRELIEVIKNPNDIVKAHETARNQMELTEQQQQKYDDAKAFIAKYDAQTAQLLRDQTDLAAAQAEHAANVNQFKTEKETSAVISAKAQAEINTNVLAHAEVAKQLASDRRAFDIAKKDFTQYCQIKEKEISDRTGLLGVREQKVDADKKASDEYASILKQKAAKLREQIANI